jgi:hypothetical protein
MEIREDFLSEKALTKISIAWFAHCRVNPSFPPHMKPPILPQSEMDMSNRILAKNVLIKTAKKYFRKYFGLEKDIIDNIVDLDFINTYMCIIMNQQLPNYKDSCISFVCSKITTAKNIGIIKKELSINKVAPTEKEINIALCNHKDEKTKNIDLHVNCDETYTCNICKSTFTLIDPAKISESEIKEICTNFTNLIQSIKTLIDAGQAIPSTEYNELYKLLIYIPKIPELFETAADNFYKYNENSMMEEHLRPPFYSMGMLAYANQVPFDDNLADEGYRPVGKNDTAGC